MVISFDFKSIGTLIIRIGFWCISYCNHSKDTPPPTNKATRTHILWAVIQAPYMRLLVFRLGDYGFQVQELGENG